MSRAAEKKPVGFATQLTAGGIAGAMEAVSNASLSPLASLNLRAYVLADPGFHLLDPCLLMRTGSGSPLDHPSRRRNSDFCHDARRFLALRAYSYAASHWIPSKSECNFPSPAVPPG